jgi:pyridoxine 5-phosphate synthase
VQVLRQTVRTRLNLEMATTQEMTHLALTAKPDQVTLVPERREEVTTEGGLDVVLNSVQVRPMIKTLQEAGIEVSVFIDPELEQVKEAHKLDAHAVELNTAAWSDAASAKAREGALRKLTDAARLGRKLALAVHAGHGLDYRNVAEIAALSELSELNIGHSIVARAVLVGMERAVREMADTMRAARSGRV